VRDRAVFLVDDIDDAKRSQEAGVERLSAGRGVERRAVERHDEPLVAVFDALDRRVKRLKIRIGVVEAVGHRAWRMPSRKTRKAAGPRGR